MLGFQAGSIYSGLNSLTHKLFIPSIYPDKANRVTRKVQCYFFNFQPFEKNASMYCLPLTVHIVLFDNKQMHIQPVNICFLPHSTDLWV